MKHKADLYNCHTCGETFYGFEADSWIWSKNSIDSRPVCPECNRGDNIHLVKRGIEFELTSKSEGE